MIQNKCLVIVRIIKENVAYCGSARKQDKLFMSMLPIENYMSLNLQFVLSLIQTKFKKLTKGNDSNKPSKEYAVY